MRHIVKNGPIPEFVEFAKEVHTNWDDIHDGRKYPGLYNKCRDYILKQEQGGVSGYTEIPISENSRIHIDHFRKKSMNWGRNVTFEWDNLVVDVLDNDYGACCKDKHVKDIKDYDMLINPVEEDPHHYFKYLSNGSIVPKDGLSDREKQKALFTIDAFNLEGEYLKNRRLSVMKVVEPYLDYLSKEEILQALGGMGFPSVIEYICDSRV